MFVVAHSPSGLDSKSHKALTAIVDKRHAKVCKGPSSHLVLNETGIRFVKNMLVTVTLI